MAVNITCPKCQTEILISQAFQGTQIPCPKCSATLILELTTITDSVPQNRRFLIPPISLVEQNSSLQEQAVAHLGNWLDVPTTQIKQALELLKDTKAYTLWQIPKGDGKSFRQISAPHNILKAFKDVSLIDFCTVCRYLMLHMDLSLDAL